MGSKDGVSDTVDVEPNDEACAKEQKDDSGALYLYLPPVRGESGCC